MSDLRSTQEEKIGLREGFIVAVKVLVGILALGFGAAIFGRMIADFFF